MPVYMNRCVYVCVCVCAHAFVCVCVCVLGRGLSWVFASTVLVVLWITVCLTSYSDYLTSFCESLLPPCRCHTGLKKSSLITGALEKSCIILVRQSENRREVFDPDHVRWK